MGEHAGNRRADLAARRQQVLPQRDQGWEQPADNTSLELFFRPGMKWSDGGDLDADDIVFWWADIQQNENITPELSPRYRS